MSRFKVGDKVTWPGSSLEIGNGQYVLRALKILGEIISVDPFVVKQCNFLAETSGTTEWRGYPEEYWINLGLKRVAPKSRLVDVGSHYELQEVAS